MKDQPHSYFYSQSREKGAYEVACFCRRCDGLVEEVQFWSDEEIYCRICDKYMDEWNMQGTYFKKIGFSEKGRSSIAKRLRKVRKMLMKMEDE